MYGDGRSACRRSAAGSGYVPQEGALFPHLTVAANVGFGLPRRDRRRRRARASCSSWSGSTPALAERLPARALRRAAAAGRAGAGARPAAGVVLLDEPFASLDAALRDETRRAVAAALAAAGATAVLVTHDQAEALSLADQVAVMRDGPAGAARHPPETVYRPPVDAGVAALRRRGGAAAGASSTTAGPPARSGSLPVRGRRLGPGRAGAASCSARSRSCSTRPGAAGGGQGLRRQLLRPRRRRPPRSCSAGPEVVARVAGHTLPEPGATVRLTVAGEALAYPFDP